MPNSKSQIASYIRSRLPTGQFARGVALLAGSNALGQIILLAAAPILTRLYSPEDFGLLALYMSITGVLQVILSMHYERAIPLSENINHAMALLKLCLFIVFLISLLSLCVVILFRHTFAIWVGAPAFANYLWMMPISLFLIGSFNTFNFWCIREGSFSLIGKARLKQVLASLVVQISGSSQGSLALIGGQVANQVMGMSSLGAKPLRMSEFKSVGFADMRKVLIRFRRFPMYSTWASLLNSFSTRLPTLFFVILFGPAVAGFYAITNRVLRAPANVFASALNNVFLKSAATAHRDGNLRQLTLETYKNCALMAMPLLFLLAIISPELFAIVFGEQWVMAGFFARWVTILVFFSVVAAPLTQLFIIYEKQPTYLVYQVILLICRALGIIAGAKIGDPVIAIMLFSITSAVITTGFLIWVGVQIGNGLVPMALYTLQALCIALVVSTPIVLANFLNLGPGLRFLAVFSSLILCCLHLLMLAKKIK